MLLQVTVCLSILEGEPMSHQEMRGWGSRFSIFLSGRPIVPSSEEMDIFGFLSHACNFRGPVSTRGDSGLLGSCKQSDFLSDFTVV